MKLLHTSIVAFLALAAPVAAQCPQPVAGNTAAEILANQQRIVCLQRELAAETARRQQVMEIDAINQRLRQLETQRQFDRLDFDIPVYRPPQI